MATTTIDPSSGKADPEGRLEVAFLLLDGLRRPRAMHPDEVVLCALGLTREGTPRPLALRVAPSEDERAWRALLRDLKAEGIAGDLLLICCDGHPALIKAIHTTYPDTPLQVSVAHRLLALARKVDTRWRAVCLREAREIFSAPDRAVAVARFREWHARWLQRGELAARSLEADLASCLTFYRFPSHLWRKIRTVNLVERLFRQARRAALPASPALMGEWENLVEGDEAAHPYSSVLESTVPEESRGDGDAGFPVAHAAESPSPDGAGSEGGITSVATVIPPTLDRERDEIIAAGPSLPAPHLIDLSKDAAMEGWLNGYRRRRTQARHLGMVLALTSVAGLMAGLILSLSW